MRTNNSQLDVYCISSLTTVINVRSKFFLMEARVLSLLVVILQPPTGDYCEISGNIGVTITKEREEMSVTLATTRLSERRLGHNLVVFPLAVVTSVEQSRHTFRGS